MFQSTEVVIERGDFRVFQPQRPLHQRQRPPVKPLSLIESAHVFVEHGQVVADGCDLHMITSTEEFRQRQRAQVKRLGFGIPPLRALLIGCAAKQTDLFSQRSL